MKNKRQSFHGTQHPHAKLKTPCTVQTATWSLLHSPLFATTLLLKPKAGKKQRQFSFSKLCPLASCHLQKLFPLLRTLFHQASIHMYFPRKPSLDWAGECSPSPGPPHPNASSCITMAFDTSLPKDARHLSAGATLVFNHSRLSS